MEFRILGPLEVSDEGHELPLGGNKPRAVLAILLLHANEVVPSDRLIDELWGERAPPTAAKTLQAHVSRLRQALERGSASGPDGVIQTRRGGYLIQVAPEQLDRTRFESLLADGTKALSNGAPERAAELLEEAVGLWRGPALADFSYESFAQAEIARLEELRLTAVEQRVEAELALGRHAQAVGELESLVERHPFRERLRAQLMLALYRSGRQAEALAAYQDARRALVDELGIEPGEELRELQSAILAQDPSLGEPRRAAAPTETAAIVAPEHRRPLVIAGFLAVVLALAGLVVLLARGDGEDAGVPPLTEDSHAVAVIDPGSNRVTTAVPVGTNPGPLAFEPRSDSLWVGNLDDESVTRIDPRAVRAGRTVAIGERPFGLAAGDGGVWVAGAPRTRPFVTARRIDPRFDRAERPVRIESLPGAVASLALAKGSLWVAPSTGLLTRLDSRTGAVTGPGTDVGHEPSTVAAGHGAVWVADEFAAVVSRIDPSTRAPFHIPVAGGPADIALARSAAWVTLRLDDSVARIDPATGTVRSTIGVGARPRGVAVGAGAVWVANSGDGTVSRLDPERGRVTDTIPVGASPQDVAVADGRVWVSVRPREELDRAETGGTIRVEIPEDVDTLDPGLAYAPYSWAILNPACAKLLNYPSRQGAGDIQLVPELAESLPKVSDGGRTYTFRIRRGFRFSPPSGEPVTAQALKYTIERSLHPSMQSGATGLVTDLVGGSAYAAGRARHIAGVTAEGNTLTLRLVRPSSTFAARISLPFFCAVPLGTPIDPEGLRKIPTAGPYYVSSHVPGQEVVLRRNPYYTGPRPQRPDAIHFALRAGQAGTLARVEAGDADYAPFVADPAIGRRLERLYGPGSPAAKKGKQRYFVNTALQVDELIFNTSREPFSSARLRRAVNYAIDRRALAQQGLFSPMPAVPTDQYLPPAMPGFRDRRIYPVEPDLEKARRLAGPGRRSVVLYALTDPSHVRMAEIVKANLRPIGIDVEIKARGSHFERVQRRGEPFDLALAGWASDFPDATDILQQFDGRTIRADLNLNLAYFDDPGFNARLDAAAALPSPARELALGRLDTQLVREAAPWAAIANERFNDFFSERIGCQIHNPIYGMDLGALCIRGEKRE